MLPSRLQQERALIADVKSSAQQKHNVSRQQTCSKNEREEESRHFMRRPIYPTKLFKKNLLGKICCRCTFRSAAIFTTSTVFLQILMLNMRSVSQWKFAKTICHSSAAPISRNWTLLSLSNPFKRLKRWHIQLGFTLRRPKKKKMHNKHSLYHWQQTKKNLKFCFSINLFTMLLQIIDYSKKEKATIKSMEQNISYDDNQVYGNKIFHMTTSKSIKVEYFI